MKLPNLIKKYLEKTGLTQSFIATAIGYDKAQMSMLINNRWISSPSLHKIKLLIETLDIPQKEQYAFVEAARNACLSDKVKEFDDELVKLSPEINREKAKHIAQKTFEKMYNLDEDTAKIFSDPIIMGIAKQLVNSSDEIKQHISFFLSLRTDEITFNE